MTSRWTEMTIDAVDPRLLATFWCDVLGWVIVSAEGDLIEIAPRSIDDSEQLAAIRSGSALPSIVFAPTNDDKPGKNRLHLDVSPIDCTHDEEVERLLALGASPAEIGQTGAESWTVLADPEGNEFCVVRSLAEGSFSL